MTLERVPHSFAALERDEVIAFKYWTGGGLYRIQVTTRHGATICLDVDTEEKRTRVAAWLMRKDGGGND